MRGIKLEGFGNQIPNLSKEIKNSFQQALDENSESCHCKVVSLKIATGCPIDMWDPESICHSHS